MKKIIIILSLILAVSCTKYLDIKPFGKTIPKTPEEFSALLNTHLRNIELGEKDIFGNVSSIVSLECYSDNLNASLISDYNANGRLPVYIGDDLSKKQQVYINLYNVIKDCNVTLDYMKNDGSELYNNVKATAYGLRGLCYYDLLINYCDVPTLEPQALGVPIVANFNIEKKTLRSPISNTVDRCVSDFKKVLEIGVNNPIFLFNNDIINAYLAQTYFWAGDYENAISYAQKVLDKYPLLSGEQYADMIKSYITPKGNVLMKSCTLFKDNELVYNTEVNSAKARPLSKSFIDLFKEKDKDIRYNLTIGDKRKFNKYPLACIRSAKMKLIIAESYYHIGDNNKALDELNEFRSMRIADYQPYTMETLPAVDADYIIKKDALGKELTPLIYAILCERQKEFFMEGDRWYELKRNGKPEFWVAKLGRKWTTLPYMYVFPLPVQDIYITPGLVQNPNYDQVK